MYLSDFSCKNVMLSLVKYGWYWYLYWNKIPQPTRVSRLGDSFISHIFEMISYFNFSICSWESPEYFMIRLMSSASASIFLAISRTFWFMPFSMPSAIPSYFAVSMEFLISRYANLLASYSLISWGVNLAISASSKSQSKTLSHNSFGRWVSL